MKCECGQNTRAVDVRKIAAGVWRRRVCPACKTVITTLEQVCETLANPYRSSKTGETVEGQVVAPPVPAVARPNPPEKRSKATRKPSPTGQYDPQPAAFAPRQKETQWNVGRPTTVAHVDRVTPSARDRIEDMKFEREQNGHGWDK